MLQKLVYICVIVSFLIFMTAVGLALYQNRESGIENLIALASVSQAASAATIMYFAKKTLDLNDEAMRVKGKLTVFGCRQPINQGKLSGTFSVINHARIAQTVLSVTIYIDGWDALETSLRDSKDSTKQLSLPFRIKAGDAKEFHYEVELSEAGFRGRVINKDSKYTVGVLTAYDTAECSLYDLSNPKDLYKVHYNLD